MWCPARALRKSPTFLALILKKNLDWKFTSHYIFGGNLVGITVRVVLRDHDNFLVLQGLTVEPPI